MEEKKKSIIHTSLFWFILQLCALSVYAWNIDEPEYNAVIGDEVKLPCNITPPTPDDSISLVLWYRGDSGNPIYSVDARNLPPDKAEHFASEVLGSRAFFNLSSKVAQLRIQRVVDSDAGEYRCRVDFRRARTMNKAMKLNVIVPPEKILIFNNENRSTDGLVGPFRENVNLNLTCEARGGRPSPSVTWWRESILVDESYTRMERGLVVNELLVANLTRKDLMSVYTCQASNTNLTMPISTHVTVDLILKPLDVRIMNPEEPLSAGTRYELTCQSTGSRPSAEIAWFKGDVKFENAQESKSGENTTSILTFVPSSEDNRKRLVCRAENPDLPESALTDHRTMDVHYVPQLSLALGASDIHEEIREGASVYFECNIQANPQIKNVTWRFEQKPLLSDPQSGIIIENNSLRLQGVRRSHRGNYQCVATNSQGEGVSEETMLRVQFAPVCSHGQKTVYGAARHEEITVTCEVDADPTMVEFVWSFNNTEERIDIISKSKGTKSEATYVPRDKNDYGELYCWGRNNVGMQLEPCIFTIVLTGPPEPVHNCSISNFTSSAVILKCKPGDSGGLKQKFHLEVYHMSEADNLLNNDTSMDSPYFEAHGLTSGSSFNFIVYSSNEKGRSRTVSLTASTLFAAERHIGDVQPVAISAVLVALMGTVGALVLLAIVIIFIMKTRADKENRGAKSSKDSEEKISSKIKKDFDDGSPDVIPSKNYSTDYADVSPQKPKENYGYRGERIYENVGESREHTYENIIPRVKYKPKINYDDITYAELDLPNNQHAVVRERIEPPTEYADIDFQKITKTPPSSCNENEDDACVQTPLITSKPSGGTSSISDKESLQLSPPV